MRPDPSGRERSDRQPYSNPSGHGPQDRRGQGRAGCSGSKETEAMKPICTDEEFIELWKTHGSTTEIAKILKLAPQNVNQRRRRIEARRNIPLNATKNPQKAHHYKHLNPVEYSARRHLEVSDGTVIIFSD